MDKIGVSPVLQPEIEALVAAKLEIMNWIEVRVMLLAAILLKLNCCARSTIALNINKMILLFRRWTTFSTRHRVIYGNGRGVGMVVVIFSLLSCSHYGMSIKSLPDYGIV